MVKLSKNTQKLLLLAGMALVVCYIIYVCVYKNDDIRQDLEPSLNQEGYDDVEMIAEADVVETQLNLESNVALGVGPGLFGESRLTSDLS